MKTLIPAAAQNQLTAVTGFAAVTALAAATPALAATVQFTPQNPVVELNVTEEIRSVPDVATFGTGVQTKAPTASEALRLNSAEMTRVIARLKSLGIKAEDIQTSGISLSADYEYRDNTQIFIGYQVSNSVTARVRDISRLGAVLDDVVTAGATNITGPTFSLDGDEAVVAAARAQALQRGLAQARSYARTAGYADVRLLVVSEGLSNSGPMERGLVMMADMGRKSAAPPVEGGQVGTSVSLSLTFEMVR